MKLLEVLRDPDFRLYFILITFVGAIILVKVWKKISLLMGRNSQLSPEKLLEIAEEYIRAHSSELGSKYNATLNESKIQILINCAKLEINSKELKNIKELEHYLKGQLEKEVEVVLNDKDF